MLTAHYSSFLFFKNCYQHYFFFLESAHDVREESSDGDVTDEMSEEEISDGRMAQWTESRKQE